MRTPIAGLLALALGLAACSTPAAADGRGAAATSLPATRPDPGGATGRPPVTGTVEHIVDGDTLDVRLGRSVERIRLIGIDTPESVKPDSAVECFGLEASQRLAELLPIGTEVEVTRDAELRDQYGRLLAYLLRRPDGLFVNLELAAGGFAGSLSFPPNTTFAEDIAAAVSVARQHRLGLWGSCPDPDALFS